MPTGYTSELYDGKKPVTLPQFVLNCARAFGSTIMMRDESLGTPITAESIKESTLYYTEGISRTQNELENLELMTDAELIAQKQTELIESFNSDVKYLEELKARRKRYEDMRKKVENWIPPTPEHVELKTFMLDQIDSSIDHDCNEKYYEDKIEKHRTESRSIDANTIRESRRVELLDNLNYYKRELDKINTRNEGRVQWMKDLCDSIGVEFR